MRTELRIFFPADPLGPRAAGDATFIRGLIKYAPDDFDIQYIGVTSDRQERPSRTWSTQELSGRQFDFYPLFFEKDENRKKTIPLSLRFTIALACAGLKHNKQVLLFNRIEPAIVYRKSSLPKIAVMHSDVKQQVISSKTDIYWSKLPRFYMFFQGIIYSSINCVYSVSRETLELYKRKFPEQKHKFQFLPTFYDDKIFSPSDEDKHTIRKRIAAETGETIPAGSKWMLFVGRLQKVKAPFRLIDVFCEHYKTNQDSCLIILGEGTLMGPLREYIKKSNQERNIFVLGNVEPECLADFYRAADVLLMVSNFEGMPLCILEALSCGLPVVSTKVGAVEDVVKNGSTGEIVESFEPAVIAKSVNEVLAMKDMYRKEVCTQSVLSYRPHIVLGPVYEKIMGLQKRTL